MTALADAAGPATYQMAGPADPHNQTTTTEPEGGDVLRTRPPYDSDPTSPREISVEATEIHPVGRYDREQIGQPVTPPGVAR